MFIIIYNLVEKFLQFTFEFNLQQNQCLSTTNHLHKLLTFPNTVECIYLLNQLPGLIRVM